MVLVRVLTEILGVLGGNHSTNIDSVVFKMHYFITSTMLMCFCVVVTTNSLVGDPISCMKVGNNMFPYEAVNTYCWTHTTYTMPKYLNTNYGQGTDVLHPGVGPGNSPDGKVYHAYYQWVPFVFFMQGLMFYIPYYLWVMCEGGKLNSIMPDSTLPVMEKEERQKKTQLLADYLHATKNYHNLYTIKFLLCEFLNLVNTLFNMWLMNMFLEGMFWKYGIDVIKFTLANQEDRTDPMIVLFPRMTKCIFNTFGYSGSMESHDFLCVLALNIINEKLYLIMWFWFVILACVTFLGLFHHILVFCVPPIRSKVLQRRAKLCNTTIIEEVGKKLQVGDFFLLYLLSKNMDLTTFSSLMEELSYRLGPDLDMTPGRPSSYVCV